MIVRDFQPTEQPFAGFVQNGGIVFRDDRTGERIALRAVIDNGEPVAMIDYIAWESSDLAAFLYWAYQWAGASGLAHLICAVGTVEQREALINAAWGSDFRYAMLSLHPKPMEEAPIEAELPVRKPRKEKKRATNNFTSEPTKSAIPTQGTSDNPPRTYSAPLVSHFQPNRVGPPPSRGFDTD